MRAKPSLTNQPRPGNSPRADTSKKRCKCPWKPKLETFGKRKYIRPCLSLPTIIRNKLARWVFSSSCTGTCQAINISWIKINQGCPRSLIKRHLWRSKLFNEGIFWINLFWMWVTNKKGVNPSDRILMGHRLSPAEAAKAQRGNEMFRSRLQV